MWEQDLEGITKNKNKQSKLKIILSTVQAQTLPQTIKKII